MTDYPQIRTVGLSGLLVTFAQKMTEPANRAALAFRAAVDAQGWQEVSETSTSLVSTFLAVDLATTPAEAMKERLEELLKSRNWLDAPLPEPPPAGELRKVKIMYRCSICGAEVRMTIAPHEDPEPPR